MNEFIEKLIGRLEEEIEWAKSHGTEEMFRKGRISGLNTAKRISNQIAEEYNKESVKVDLISKKAVITELNGIYLDNPYDDKEDILEKAIGIVDHFPAPYQPKGE